MNRILGTMLFLSVILFSCSQSTEDAITGVWFDKNDDVTITFNADKTVEISSSFGKDVGKWQFRDVGYYRGIKGQNKDAMEICLGPTINDLYCSVITNIDEKQFCIEDAPSGNINCLSKK